MMDFELRLARPKSKGIWVEGLVMGFSYLLGGLIRILRTFTHVLFADFRSHRRAIANDSILCFC